MASAKGQYAGQRGAFYPGDVVRLNNRGGWQSYAYNVGWYGGSAKYHTTSSRDGCCIVVDRTVMQISSDSGYSERWYMFYQVIIPDGAVVWTTGVGIDTSECVSDDTYKIIERGMWPQVCNQHMKILSYDDATKIWS